MWKIWSFKTPVHPMKLVSKLEIYFNLYNNFIHYSIHKFRIYVSVLKQNILKYVLNSQINHTTALLSPAVYIASTFFDWNSVKWCCRVFGWLTHRWLLKVYLQICAEKTQNSIYITWLKGRNIAWEHKLCSLYS